MQRLRGGVRQDHHHRDQNDARGEGVLVEDQRDHVPDRGQLDEGEPRRSRCPPRALRARTARRRSRSRPARGQRRPPRARRRSCSPRGGPLTIRPPQLQPPPPQDRRGPPVRALRRDPPLDPDDVVGEAASLLGVVGDQHERDRGARRSARRVASTASRAPSSRAEVGSSRSRTRGSRARARASTSRAAARPPRASTRRGPRTPGRARPAPGSSACRSCARRAAGRRRCSRARSRRSVPGLGHQAPPLGAAQAVELLHVDALVEHPARVGVGEPVEQAQKGRFAAPGGPAQLAPMGRRAVKSRSTAFPDRE